MISRANAKKFAENAKHRDGLNARLALLVVLWQILAVLIEVRYGAEIARLIGG